MANISSKLSADENLKVNNFSVDLIFRPSILDNIINWKVYEEYEQIFHFLHCEKDFKNVVIDEDDHNEAI